MIRTGSVSTPSDSPVFLKSTMRAFIFKNDRKDGFTFMELLVVIATVGMLAVLLLPALAGTKPNSQSFQCMENQRQMVLASQMYSDDNGGKIAPNYPQGGPNGPDLAVHHS